MNPPFGRKKVIVSTNIAETSVTIPGITTVIDSGLAKLNYYNPRSFTSSLNETLVSKASCNQRKGRAGRTQSGVCYRLYPRKDFENRSLYTMEEIYRTDLCEVVLRMAELGIRDFEQFEFISPPGREGLIGGIETLNMLGALESDKSLSKTGELMAAFPLMPRQSRIIVEAILRYPDVIKEVLIAAAFLSAHSPFMLPPGEESDARRAHHEFRDMRGDFMSYVKIFTLYTEAKNKARFCEKTYLDERVMAEIVNIKEQLEQIVGSLGIPVLGGGHPDDYLTCIAAGMIQFVCIREKKESYQSLTAEHIQIHPGSCMFRGDPLYIVAGEIVRTSRMFAMSVSPLTKAVLSRLDGTIAERLAAMAGKGTRSGIKNKGRDSDSEKAAAKRFSCDEKDMADKQSSLRKKERLSDSTDAANVNAESVIIGGIAFTVEKIKGKKHLIMPYPLLQRAAEADEDPGRLAQAGKLRVKVEYGKHSLLTGERLSLALRVVKETDLRPLDETEWERTLNLCFAEKTEKLIAALPVILRTAPVKKGGKEIGFIGLCTDGRGTYRFKVSKNFGTALNTSLSSLEVLIDEAPDSLSETQKAVLNRLYRKLNDLYE